VILTTARKLLVISNAIIMRMSSCENTDPGQRAEVVRPHDELEPPPAGRGNHRIAFEVKVFMTR
jgi:hypothetical protein